MERADIVTMANAVHGAFLSAGRDVTEKKTGIGSVFLVEGRALGQMETGPSAVRVRLWLGEKDRRVFESRPTFDQVSGWLHVVSEEDISAIRGLLPAAHKAALSGSGLPSSPPPPAPDRSTSKIDAERPATRRAVRPRRSPPGN